MKTREVRRKRTWVCARVTACLGVVLLAASASAEQSPKIHDLELKQDPEIQTAKIASVHGVTDQGGVRFKVQHLTIRQPVIVAVHADDAKRKLRLQLFKYRTTAERSGVTDADGVAYFAVYTEGDINILVQSESGTLGYSLVVWVAEEEKQPIPSMFVPFSTRHPKTDGKGSSRGSNYPGPLMGILVPALGMCRSSWRRQRRRATVLKTVYRCLMVLLWFGISSHPAIADEKNEPKGVKLAEWWTKSFETSLKIYEKYKKSEAAHKLIGEYLPFLHVSPLTVKGCKPEDYRPPGMPKVPSHCAQAPSEETITFDFNGRPVRHWDDEGCNKCYSSVMDRLDHVREKLERLRCLGEENKETYDTEIAFGESVASIPNAGLGWYEARQQIEEGEEVFRRSYDKKYAELLAELEQDLKDVNYCEETFFHEHNWYERFGWMYLQFTAGYYRRRQ